MSKFTTLLEKGYFPAQLPPCFTTRLLAKRGVRIRRLLGTALASLPSGHPYRAGPRLELYSVARSSRSRRPISIPNPIAQLGLASAIADHWPRIARHLDASPLTMSRPKFEKGQSRAVTITSHSKLHEYRLTHSRAAHYVLLTDVSQFFPTLYTHSIPWALHGKDKAKAKRNDPRLLGNILDKAVQRTQNQQTLGIPIGPDTSHVISEIVGTALDVELGHRFLEPIRGYRHVDDFVLFFDSLSEAEKGLSHLEATVHHYELKLNPQKTRLVELSEFAEELWPHELLAFSFSEAVTIERRQLTHFFEKAFHLSAYYKDEAVIRFALRHAGTHVVKRPNWDLLQLYLLRCAAAYPGSVQDVAHLFFTYATIGYQPDKDRLQESLHFLLRKHLPLGHHSECAWALWLAMHFAVPLRVTGLEAELHESSSSILILANELTESGLLKPKIDKRRTRYLADPSQLYDTLWLASYELGCSNVLSAGQKHILGDPLFKLLRDSKIRFFDKAAMPEPLFAPVKPVKEEAYESDEDISDSFEFTPASDTYGTGTDEDENREEEEDDDRDDKEDFIDF